MQVGSGARTVGKRLGRRDEGFDALWSRFGAAGDVLEEFEDGDPTHTQNLESRSHRPRAWCVCVWVWGRGPISHRGSGSVKHRTACVCGNSLPIKDLRFFKM